MLRVIREVQPRYVVGENVPGLISWNRGLVFDEVQADLENEGYEVTPFLLPACGVNAPHRRDRVWFVAYADMHGHELRGFRQDQSTPGESESKRNKWERIWDDYRGACEQGVTSNTSNEQLQRSEFNRGIKSKGSAEAKGGQFSGSVCSKWQQFPTQSPVRLGNDGLSRKLERYITKELEYEISKASEINRVENLSEMWERISEEEIWEQIRGFYSLESKEVLFQTMQLYSTGWAKQRELSPFSEDFSRPIMQHLSKYKQFGCSPQGRELEKQREEELGNIMPYLPHEVALASKTFEKRLSSFDSKWRNESIKAAGNAIVPQVAFEIFKVIDLLSK